MKQFTLFTFLITVFITGFTEAQTIEGYVYDSKTKEPLPGVTVYFDASSVGTTTDAQGFFTLTTPAKMTSALIISYMGYSALQVPNPYSGEVFQIYLDEISMELEEVVLQADPYTREQKMKFFKEQFLGTGYKGSCEIVNEDDIIVTYNGYKRTLMAFSDAPLQIENSYLGYTVTYNLVDFKAQFFRDTMLTGQLLGVFYAGSSYFKDTSKGKGRFVRRRQKAYFGSSLHFLRTTAQQKWDEEEFKVFKGSFQTDPKNHFSVTDTLGYKWVKATQPKWSMLYKGEQSGMQIQNEGIYIDNFGNFAPINGVTFNGYMGSLRFKQMLPLDYYPPED